MEIWMNKYFIIQKDHHDPPTGWIQNAPSLFCPDICLCSPELSTSTEQWVKKNVDQVGVIMRSWCKFQIAVGADDLGLKMACGVATWECSPTSMNSGN